MEQPVDKVMTMILFGVMTESQAFQFVDWNVILILLSIWIISGYFGRSGVPDYLAALLPEPLDPVSAAVGPPEATPFAHLAEAPPRPKTASRGGARHARRAGWRRIR